MIATTSENDEDVCKAVAWLGDSPVAVSGDAHVYSHVMDPMFVAYYFQSSHFQAQKRRYITGTKLKRVSGSDMARITIPVPPLEVQREIAAILNKMERLEAELEAELEARRMQYTHYANELVRPAGGTPTVRLGEVARIVRGASPRPIQQFMSDGQGGMPWIKIGDVPANGKYITGTKQFVTLAGAQKSRRVQPGDFVLSNSMSFGRPYISKIEGYIHDGWLAISEFESSFSADYLYYLLRSSPVQTEFASLAGAGTVKNLNADIVKGVEVPRPDRRTQDRVVGVLDAFDALLNDLSSGLPAEIAARRKQYEHYRDRLLTFKGLPA